MTIYNEIGNTILQQRKHKGYSQEQLALECEISVSYLRLIEHGQANPTIRELLIIVDGLEIDFRNPLVIPEDIDDCN